MNLINSPIWNKGTSFTPEERDAFALEGLLPPYVETLEEQVARAYSGLRPDTSDLQKHIYLRGIQDTNEVLFYRLLLEHPEELVPLIYKPTVREGCRKFADIYRRPRGMFIAYPFRDRIPELLRSRPYLEVDMIVVTDGGQIPGIGDVGVNGLAAPIGKLSLYSLFGGIHPSRTLPIVLDVGTNNPALLNDPAYSGWRHKRIGEEEYFGFLDQFVSAIQKEIPNVCVEWEDLPPHYAQRVLDRYGTQIPTFNDNLQGTAAVVVATLEAAFKLTGGLFRDEEIVLFGDRPEALKTAGYLCEELQRNGLSPSEARRRIWLVDNHGVLHDKRDNLNSEQRTYAQPAARISSGVKDGHIGAEDIVRNVKVAALVELSAVNGELNERVIRTVAARTQQPIVLSLSPLTSFRKSRAEELVRWTEGRGVVATADLPATLPVDGRNIDVTCCSTVYVFPGVGLGHSASYATQITDGMMLAAARELARHSPALENPQMPLLPSVRELRRVAADVAFAVGLEAQNAGVAPHTSEEELLQEIQITQWHPEYPAVLHTITP